MHPSEEHREEFVALLERQDRRAAIRHAIGLIDAGMTLGDFVLGVLAPAQVEVGLRWQNGRWSPAQEHAATDIADTVLAVAAARVEPADARGSLVLCLVEREHHNLPARMIAELLRAEGMQVTFLGAPTGMVGVSRFLETSGADALVLSCSLAMNVPGAVPLVLTAHGAGVPVIAGGRGFGSDGTRATRLGCDGWAATVPDVRTTIEAWSAESPSLRATTAEVAQQKELAAIRQVLTDELAERITYRYPGIIPRGPRSERRLRGDLRTLLRFLEAALLCDERILAEYADWFAARASAQGYDAGLVPLMFHLIEERLALDLPAAAAPLRAARSAAQVAITGVTP